MKKLLAASVAAASVYGAPVLAADLPVKAPAYVAPAPVPGWTGPYLGVAGGYGWGHSNQTDPGLQISNTSPIGDGHFGLSGGLLGGTLGYNWQNGQWVFGVEGDYSWADISGQSSVCGPTPPTIPHPCGTKIESLGTVRARIGPVVGNALPYVTGGWAFGDVHGWDSLFPASGSAMYSGWTIGGGIEWRLDPRWSAKIEYLYVDLGNRQLFNIIPGVPETVSATANVIRVGLNYKFGDWGKAPVVAKY